MNYLLAQKWRLGLALGLMTSVLLILLLHNGWHNDIGIEKPVRWLASCPPLTWLWVMELGQEIQYGLLLGWWAAAGAVIGWLADGNRADKGCALLLLITLISAHNLAYNNIGLAVERQINHFKMEVDRLF